MYSGPSPSGLTVIYCTICDDSAIGDGGGMLDSFSNPTVTNCTFTGKSTFNNGGGMSHLISNPTVANCTFTENSADLGGGIFTSDNCSLTVTELLI